MPSTDATALYDRKEFWILSDDAFPHSLSELDEYRITFETDGVFRICRNNDRNSIRAVAFGDASLKFYPFFFLNGRINGLSLMDISSSNPIPEPHPRPPENSEDGLCKICYDEPADLVLIPCGHVFFCSDCKSRYEEKSGTKCPVCRKDYQTALKIAT